MPLQLKSNKCCRSRLFAVQCFCCQVPCVTVTTVMQVLRSVLPEHEREVCAGSAADVRTACKLPASLLSKWIAYSTGDLDLRSEHLSSEQWMTMAAAICQAPSGAVKSLHVGLPVSGNDVMVAILALQSIVAHRTHLQCLGLHDLHSITNNDLSALHTLFCECPGSLAKLLLDTEGTVFKEVRETATFFAAVAEVHSLRELHVPQWSLCMTRYQRNGRKGVTASGGRQHPEACGPLRSVLGLKIFVSKSDLEDAALQGGFASDLNFQGTE